MKTDRLLILLFVLIWALAFIHIAAEYFYLYWQFRWFDMVTHYIGGVWVGLAALWLWYYSGYIRRSEGAAPRTLLVALVAGVSVGIVWELYEYVVWQLSGRGLPPNYLPDTALDVCMDILGAFSAYVLFTLLRRRNGMNSEPMP